MGWVWNVVRTGELRNEILVESQKSGGQVGERITLKPILKKHGNVAQILYSGSVYWVLPAPCEYGDEPWFHNRWEYLV
jgi:hypothetical protein